MGAESDAYTMLDPEGNTRAAAGLCATVRDMGRLGQIIANPAESEVGVPDSWVRDMLQNGSQEAYAAGTERAELEGLFDTAAYRSYWIMDKASQTLMASGTNGQSCSWIARALRSWPRQARSLTGRAGRRFDLRYELFGSL